MNSSQFKINEFKKFCSIVCFKPEEVEKIANNLEKYYKEWIEKKLDKDAVLFLNVAKTWVIGDILNYYVKNGYEEYQKLTVAIATVS